jgi:PIN domain nuclease of toxin-antitoxin system
MGSRDLSAVVLDTCAVLWLANGDPLERTGLAAIRAAQAAEAAFVSPITAWEIGTKTSKGRLRLDLEPEAWFERFIALPGIRLADLTPRILIASTALPARPPADPADRIVVATARAMEVPVVTRDRQILPYAAAGHVRAVRC